METSNIEVILEKLKSLKESNTKEHSDMEKRRDEARIEYKEWRDKTEDRITVLEHWQEKFVAKFSVYSAIALFLGSALATLIINFISKYL